jgi:hypothetical protein
METIRAAIESGSFLSAKRSFDASYVPATRVPSADGAVRSAV